jgi:small GTP-binding protein
MISDTDYAAIEAPFSRKVWFHPEEQRLPGFYRQIYMYLRKPQSKLKRVGASMEYQHLVKILMVGNSAVGKTSCLCRFADNEFTQNWMANIGIDFKIVTMETINPTVDFDGKTQTVKLQLWDTAGQERFRNLPGAYFRGVHTVILAYAVDDKDSFDALSSRWALDVEKYGPEGARIVVAACKTDLPREEWAVSGASGRLLASQLGAKFIETSAKDGTNIDLLYGHAGTIGLDFLLQLKSAPVRVVPVLPNESKWGKWSSWISSFWPFSRNGSGV